ncbi:hypothetical protein LINPERPRIM_LOCUS18948 [Linum perenne]
MLEPCIVLVGCGNSPAFLANMHWLVLPIIETLSSPIATHATPLKITGWHTGIQ